MRALRLMMALLTLLAACARPAGGPPQESPLELTGEASEVTVYSGRSEELVAPVFEKFEEQTGVAVRVKYGDTAELASLLLEEGPRSPADLFLAQDAGALGAVSKEGLFVALPDPMLEEVPAQFRSRRGDWVGITGRARTVVYNTESLSESDLPASILGFADPKWKGKLGWAPTNGSFQAFVTALRALRGEEAARGWLEAVKANDAQAYQRNSAIVAAVASGEIEAGFVNHYYLLKMKQDDPAIRADNYFFGNRDPGGLVNVSGAGILGSSRAQSSAARLIEFMLSPDAQRHWAGSEFEYPLVPGVPASPDLPPLASLDPPDIDLADLEDLQGTLRLLGEAGLI